MDYRSLIVESGKRMSHSGLTVETWGNISYRDPETGLVYLTPSGMNYDTIVEDDIVVLDLDGNRVRGKRRPTIETGMHLGIYKARPEINAVIHTHPLYSMVYACKAEPIPLFMDEAAQMLGDVVRPSEYALPGTPEMAEAVIKVLGKKAMSCLVRSHGAVCLGQDMETAFKVCTVLEVTAHIYQMIQATGGAPAEMTQENIDAMQNFVKYHYGQVEGFVE